MKELLSTYLKACSEAVIHQQELLSLMASHLNLSADKILYEWASGKFKQWGSLNKGEWSYLFHGMECDFKNTIDGRFLRVDFGPRGRTDTFTSCGITQFILSSKPPWSEFEELREYFAKAAPSDNRFSGPLDKMNLIWSKLEQSGLIEKADQTLIDLAAKFTCTGRDGLAHIVFPPGTSDLTVIDCAVAGRYKLGRQGEFENE